MKLHWLVRAAVRSRLSGADRCSVPPGTRAIEAWVLVSRQLGIPQSRLAALIAPALALRSTQADKLDTRAIEALAERWARLHHVCPVRVHERVIVIATCDPTDLAAEQAISFATARKVVFELASPHAINDAIDRAYGNPPKADATTVAVADDVLADAVGCGASDIHIEPGPNGGTVRFRVDGLLRPHMPLAMDALARVVSRIKVLGRLDIADRTRPQDGRARVDIGGTTCDLRISTIPTRDAEKAVIRILRPGTAQSLEDTGMPARERALFRQLLGARDGLVLVTGPTGSGKTTSLYAALREVARREINITTVEDPIEYELAGITQVQVEPKRDITFASALRAILRQDPDVILVGEIRDSETAQIALQAALTGHLVLATLHTNDALSAVTRLADLGLERASIAAAVRGSVAQRLVRKVCAHCVATAGRVLTPEERRLAAAYGVKPMVRASGCSSCGNTGYRGRLPLVEVALATPDLKAMIAAGASSADLQAAAIAHDLRTLRDSAMARVRAGETTLEEIDRVIGTTSDDTLPRRNVLEFPAPAPMTEASHRFLRDIGLALTR
ncbi:MAG TPA: GspE/PulE family protein [Gemmatimonadaceae bacterium]|nr:GspE/PulE family protein [Gemmatimonadaceae bacterium]